jgi:protein SCO1/2
MIAALVLASVALVAAASPPIDHVTFAPRDGAALPADARFVDEHEHASSLAELVASRPAIIVPAYYGCSNLCGVVLSGVAASLTASGLRAGRDADVVAVSIAPSDTPADASAKMKTIAGAGPGWHFLTGSQASIDRFADALGYHYFYAPAERQYAHASGIVIAAPGGRIVRVLYGVTFPRTELLEALAAARSTAAPPAVATGAEVRNWLLCFHYDPHSGRYTFAAMNAARAAALLALMVLGGYIGYARIRERSR